jgi:hypothetical protein
MTAIQDDVYANTARINDLEAEVVEIKTQNAGIIGQLKALMRTLSSWRAADDKFFDEIRDERAKRSELDTIEERIRLAQMRLETVEAEDAIEARQKWRILIDDVVRWIMGLIDKKTVIIVLVIIASMLGISIQIPGSQVAAMFGVGGDAEPVIEEQPAPEVIP